MQLQQRSNGLTAAALLSFTPYGQFIYGGQQKLTEHLK